MSNLSDKNNSDIKRYDAKTTGRHPQRIPKRNIQLGKWKTRNKNRDLTKNSGRSRVYYK